MEEVNSMKAFVVVFAGAMVAGIIMSAFDRYVLPKIGSN
jgi:hypothetical protein